MNLAETIKSQSRQTAIGAYLAGTAEETSVVFTREDTGEKDVRAALHLTPPGEPWMQLVFLHAPCPCPKECCLGIVLPFEFSRIGNSGAATLSALKETDSRRPAPVAWSTFLHDDGEGAWRASFSRESLTRLIKEAEFDGPGFPHSGAWQIVSDIPAFHQWDKANPTCANEDDYL
jgi:hypothetical protein